MFWQEWSPQGLNAMGKLVADIIVDAARHAAIHASRAAIGMALYSTRAILHGRGGDVWEMVRENFL
jgi:hypothetical protein